MKYIKKFNEELDNKTYLSAADKLSYNHPNRAKKLRDHVDYKEQPVIDYSIYNILFYGDIVGTAKARLKISDSGLETRGKIPYLEVIEQDLNYSKKIPRESSAKRIENIRTGGGGLKIPSKPFIDTINIGYGQSEFYPRYGLYYDNKNYSDFPLSGDCYCTSRSDANKLKKELFEAGFNISVNKLYTDREMEKPVETKSRFGNKATMMANYMKDEEERKKDKLPWYKKEMK